MLLCKKANVLMAADDGGTRLHMSAQNGHLAVTTCLVEAGADPEAKTCQGATPLHMATQLGHSEVMAVPIEAGADVNCRSEGGRAPLYLAAQVGHLAAVKELLRAKADPLLALASSRDAIPIPPEIAALSGHSEVVRELVQHVRIAGCGGESGGAEALEGAAVESHLDIMAVLAEAGVVDAGNALHSAAGCGREVAVKFLLQHRPRGPTSDGGGYVNCRDGYGSTPLIRAIGGYSREAGKPHLIYPKVVRALIDAGADTSSAVHATNQWGKTLFKGTPLAFTNRCLRLKKVRWLEEDATEEQLHRLEAVRRLLLRVEEQCTPYLGCGIESPSWSATLLKFQAGGPTGKPQRVARSWRRCCRS